MKTKIREHTYVSGEAESVPMAVELSAQELSTLMRAIGEGPIIIVDLSKFNSVDAAIKWALPEGLGQVDEMLFTLNTLYISLLPPSHKTEDVHTILARAQFQDDEW